MPGGTASYVKAIIVAVLAALFAGCSGGTKHLSATEIQLAAGDLRTFSASAQMLIEQCSAQNATQTFCREQAEVLKSKVEGAEKGEMRANYLLARFLSMNRWTEMGISIRSVS